MQEKFVFSTFLITFAPNRLVTGYFKKVNLRKANSEQSLGSFKEYAYHLKEKRPIGFNSHQIVFGLTLCHRHVEKSGSDFENHPDGNITPHPVLGIAVPCRIGMSCGYLSIKNKRYIMKAVIFTNYNYFSSTILMREISRYRVLTRDEERALAEAVKRGDKAALDMLVGSNLRIAVTKCKQMALGGVNWEDLMGAAATGLVKAAKSFDPGRNVPFVAHAEFWITKEVLLELNTHTSTIHVPESQMRVLSKIRKVVAKYEQTHETRPTVEDIADLTGLEVSKVKAALNSCPHLSSYDVPLSDDADSATFIETMYDEKQPMPDSSVCNESEKAYLVDILSSYLKTRDDAELFYYSAVLKNPDKLQEYMDKFQISEKELVRRTNAAIAILRKSKELVQLLKRIG